MSEVATHCPYIGLKQNRAIRFSTPTAEHRCYISGDAMDIPVDQASYCLTQFHTQCPLYMGSLAQHNNGGAPRRPATRPRTAAPVAPPVDAYAPAAESYDEEWNQPPRQRRAAAPVYRSGGGIPASVYGLLIGLIAVGVVVYLYAGTLLGSGVASEPTDSAATQVPFEPLPTAVPTLAAVVPPVNDTPTAAPAAPTETAAAVVIPPAASPTIAPRATQATAAVSPTAESAAASATPDVKDMLVRLYFGDATGQLIVPVARTIPVSGKKVATAAIAALFSDPRNGLTRILLPDAALNSIAIVDGTAVLDFNKRPTGPGDVRGFVALAQTLYQFDSINKVKFLVNGTELPAENGIPYVRSATVNLWNPANLTIGSSTAVTLWFVAADGKHDIPLTKLVAKTADVAEASARALLEGPGQYAQALQRVIPDGTQLRGIRIENGTLTVDFTQPFAAATDKNAAVRTVARTLAGIGTIKNVQILVEGAPLSAAWGNDYNKTFERPAISAE
ncbi:MAG: hypothetical protein RLZZ297_1661 [Chloroflexota bacterium]